MRNLAKAVAPVGPLALWAGQHYRSEAVKAWRPTSLQPGSYGDLYARVGGDANHGHAVMLLHGLVSTGAIFGGGYDQLASTSLVVIPDLLGFGNSLDETRSSFRLNEHLDELDVLADRSGMFGCERWTLGAHSMGSTVALAWAARHKDRVETVTCWGAPVYASPADAQAHVSGTLMTRLFVLDGAWARRACELSCRHRTAAGWVTAAVEPRLPVPVAQAVPLHTWPAYRDALRDLVIEADWPGLISEPSKNGARVVLVWGDSDPIGDVAFARTVAAQTSSVAIHIVSSAGHQLPMTNTAFCLRQLREKAVTPRPAQVPRNYSVS